MKPNGAEKQMQKKGEKERKKGRTIKNQIEKGEKGNKNGGTKK
jgi:hypothetical protein